MRRTEEAISRFTVLAEIARNPAGEIGAKAAEIAARSLYWIRKCRLPLGRKNEAKDSFLRVLGIEADKSFHDKPRKDLESLVEQKGM